MNSLKMPKFCTSRFTWAAACILGGWLAARALRTPLLENISFSTALTDRQNQLLRLTLSRDDKYRLRVPLKDLSPVLVEAVLLHEDRYFRNHPGVNPYSLLRGFAETYLLRNRRIGASTITMQLARLKWGIHSRAVGGKVKQILRAFELEALYSKNEILEAYLNLVPFGGNVEGVGAASLIYFRKQPHALTLPEALSLAVIPQSPSRRTLAKDDDNAPLAAPLELARTALWHKWLLSHASDQRLTADMSLPVVTASTSDLPFQAPHFVEAVLDLPEAERGGILRTSLDLRAQTTLERQLQNYVARNTSWGVHNASAMLIDLGTSEVRALVGSADFADPSIQGQVNGTFAKRSPGSTLKPFIYGLAIDQGLIHPESLLKDTPTSFGAFDPENFDRDFQGPISATEALINSRNIPAVGLAAQIANPSLYDFLKNADVTKLREAKYYGLSIALGSAELSMAELLRLYAALGNGGQLRDTQWFASRKNSIRAGNVRQVLSPEAAFLVLDMLRKNPRPMQGSQANVVVRSELPVAWKTGTSYGFRDAWTIGLFGPYALAVWVGNFDNTSNPAFVGREMAAPLFFQIAEALRAIDPKVDRAPVAQATGKITQVKVCAISGKLPGPHCHHLKTTLFIAGKSPIETCDIHREIWVQPLTGLRACKFDPAAGLNKEIFEFWPTDILKIFRQAGIPRRTPPPFDPKCTMADTLGLGTPPVITSPKKDLVYAIRASLNTNEPLPLQARSDADAHEVFWFVGDQFLGKSPVGQPLFWKPTPGQHLVRAVDDRGRSDAREVRVEVVE